MNIVRVLRVIPFLLVAYREAHSQTAPAPGSMAQPPAFVKAQAIEAGALYAANKANNYVDAVRLCREIDAGPEVDTAFAGLALTESYVDESRVFHLGNLRYADGYASNLNFARAHLAEYYEFGLGVHRDYEAAASWYLKATNTREISGVPTGLSPIFKREFALLYAYGLGVPRDPRKARQVWVESKNTDLVRLIDNDALPKSIGDRDQFALDVKVALAKLDEEGARKQSQAAAAREREAVAYRREHPDARPSVSPTTRDSGDPYGKALCNSAWGTSAFNIMSPCNW